MPEAQGFGQERIRRLLRQRHPMLLLDRVLNLDDADAPTAIVAVKALTVSEPCYADLAEETGAAGFAYPLALELESFGQAVSVLWKLGHQAGDGTVPLLAGLREVSVTGPVLPGDVMEHRAHLVHASSASWTYAGSTWVAGREVLSVGSLLVVARPDEVLLDT